MATIRFEQVKLKGVRRWKENGKWRQETRTFMQTINPFNQNDFGMAKTRSEILAELLIEKSSWLAAPGPHAEAEEGETGEAKD